MPVRQTKRKKPSYQLVGKRIGFPATLYIYKEYKMKSSRKRPITFLLRHYTVWRRSGIYRHPMFKELGIRKEDLIGDFEIVSPWVESTHDIYDLERYCFFPAPEVCFDCKTCGGLSSEY